jgi:phosphoribosylformimino-5-aminoimidazole carboxamide ribonucleotide (ProFAR) isomerase
VIAAGGVTTPDDVRAVRALGCAGAVVGRALLDDPSQIAALLLASA